MRVGHHVERHFNVVEIREHKFAATLERFETEATPEVQQALLRVPINLPISFGTAPFDSCLHNLESKSGVAEFAANRKPFHFNKISKISDSKATRRLGADVTDQMSCRKGISIKFLVIGTLLFGHVNGAANCHNAHNLFHQ